MTLRRSGRSFFVCIVSFAVLSACGTEINPESQCRAIASQEFVGTTISSTASVTDKEGLPAFCQVRGTIDPNIRFEARFPLADWNGKYFQSGCGGYCGSVLPDKPGFSNTINEALKRGFAAITTDSGHQGGLGEASWAKNDPEAVEVFAHSGIFLTHQAGTSMVNAFYEAEPSKNYFGGCSNGGRMAAMAAQRYPQLFDGILGGGGVLHLSYSGGVYGSWVVQSNSDNDGQRILNRTNFAAKLPALERAVIAQCDTADGIEDDVISLPRRCEVDVDALPACANESTNECFTRLEKSVLRKWYQGPKNTAGEQLFPGMPAGSERFWAVWFLDTESRIAPGNQLGGRYAKYLGFEDGTPDDYTALDFDFDNDPPRLAVTGRQLDALNPDLSAFRDAGGKYLMWHGWADPLVLPDQSLSYYESVAGEMGGIENIKSFFRLFMIPGQGHCWELPANVPDQFDPINALDDWVESGDAPEMIPAHALNPATAVITNTVLCPHPATATNLIAGEKLDNLRCDTSASSQR